VKQSLEAEVEVIYTVRWNAVRNWHSNNKYFH